MRDGGESKTTDSERAFDRPRLIWHLISYFLPLTSYIHTFVYACLYSASE
jgi:hypothetical protein